MTALFQDNTGKYIIAQPPNVPLILFIVSFIIVRIAGDLLIGRIAEVIQNGSLYVWAYLEIRFGESPFRKIVGWLVMFSIIFFMVNQS